MPARLWLFLAALLGALAVVAGAVGAHVLSSAAVVDGAMLQAFWTGQINHAIHAVALLATGLLMLQTAGQRRGLSYLALQFAAFAFTIGILLFSGIIYLRAFGAYGPVTRLVPVGGVSLIAGWLALAIGTLGIGHPSGTERTGGAK